MQTSDENKKNINYGITNWADTRFSKLAIENHLADT